MKSRSLYLIQAALIAAVYAVLTLLLKPFGFGVIQFRIAEVLTVLPAILPSSIPGLFIGCILANFFGGFGPIDIIFGSLATLIAAFSTHFLRRSKFLFPLPPAVFNGLIVGSYIYLLFDKTYPWLLTVSFIALSELVICYLLGLPLITFIKGNRVLREKLNIDDE